MSTTNAERFASLFHHAASRAEEIVAERRAEREARRAAADTTNKDHTYDPQHS